MGRFQDRLDGERRVKAWVKDEQEAHYKALEGIANGDTSKADARIAKLAASIPDLRALRTRLTLQDDDALRQASFAMILPHLSFGPSITDADLADIGCHIPTLDSLTISEAPE